jgi:hypothetical protein
MKAQILNIAHALENGVISEDKAKKHLLFLFGVIGTAQPLTINRVSEICAQISLDTWVALYGNEDGWIEWYQKRNKIDSNGQQ